MNGSSDILKGIKKIIPTEIAFYAFFCLSALLSTIVPLYLFSFFYRKERSLVNKEQIESLNQYSVTKGSTNDQGVYMSPADVKIKGLLSTLNELVSEKLEKI